MSGRKIWINFKVFPRIGKKSLMAFIVDPNQFSICVRANSQTSSQELKYFIILVSSEERYASFSTKISTKPKIE